MSTIITFAMLCLTAVVADFFFRIAHNRKVSFYFLCCSSEWDFGPPQKRLHRSSTGLTEEGKKRNRYSISSAFRIDISEQNMDKGKKKLSLSKARNGKTRFLLE